MASAAPKAPPRPAAANARTSPDDSRNSGCAAASDPPPRACDEQEVQEMSLTVECLNTGQCLGLQGVCYLGLHPSGVRREYCMVFRAA